MKKKSFELLSEPTTLTEQNWPEGTIPLVHTRHMTYNHKDYIKECIEGVLMQKTTFPVQILIHDDCSTDGTTEIVNEYAIKYPKLIKLYIQEENSYSKPDKYERRKKFDEWRIGKYEAICEGDDYWIDPLKLQKQVTFLESSPDFDMVYSKSRIYNQKEKKIIRRSFGKKGCKYEELILRNVVPTLTVVIKTSMIRKYIQEVNPRNKNWLLGDYPLWLFTSLMGKIHFMNESFAVYRVLEESLSHSKDFCKMKTFIQSEYEMKRYFYNKAGNNKITLRDLYDQEHTRLLILSVFYPEISSKTYFLKISSKKIKHRFLNLISSQYRIKKWFTKINALRKRF